MIIIDATDMSQPIEKRAMALRMTGKYSTWTQCLGANILPGIYQLATFANSIMGLGSGLFMRKDFVGVDALNQDYKFKGINELKGGVEEKLPVAPLLATCESPTPEEFEAAYNRKLFRDHKLFKIKDGMPVLTNPANLNLPGYSVLDFRRVLLGTLPTTNRLPAISTSLRVSMKHQEAFDRDIVPLLRGLAPGLMGNHVALESGARATPKKDASYPISIPLDLVSEVEKIISSHAAMGDMGFAKRNAVVLFDAIKKQREATGNPIGSQQDMEQILKTPVYERIPVQGSELIIYDERDMPLGIALKQSRAVEKASHSAGGTEPDDMKLVFKTSSIRGWLALPDVGGNPTKLRDKFMSGEIQVTANDVVDARTCSPRLSKIYSQVPIADDTLVPEIENGKIANNVVNVVPEHTITATASVRVWDRTRGAEVLRAVPEDVEKQQKFTGTRVITQTPYMYVKEEDGSVRKVTASEWKHFDPDSKNKFIPGVMYRLVIAPEKFSPKKSAQKAQGALGFVPRGIFVGYVETYAQRLWSASPPSSYDDDTAIVVLKDGREVPSVDVETFLSDLGPDESKDWIANNVAGYYRITQRQHDEKPLPVKTPTAEAPAKLNLFKTMGGALLPDVDEAGNQKTMDITSDDVQTAEERPVDLDYSLFKSMRSAVMYVQAFLTMDDFSRGSYTNYNTDDLRTMYEKVYEALPKIIPVRQQVEEIENQVRSGAMTPDAGRQARTAALAGLEQWEQLLAMYTWDFEDEMRIVGDTIPEGVLQALQNIHSDPDAFEPKYGPMYGVWDVEDNLFVEDELFATEEKANLYLGAVQNDGQNPHSQHTLEVRPTAEQVPLVRGFAEAQAKDPNVAFTVKAVVGAFDSEGEGQQQLEEGVLDFEGAETSTEPIQEVPPAEEAPVGEPVGVAAPVPEQAAPVATQAPLPVPTAPKMPLKTRIAPPIDQEADVFSRLVKLADRLDGDGKHGEADAVDKLIARMRQRKEED